MRDKIEWSAARPVAGGRRPLLAAAVAAMVLALGAGLAPGARAVDGDGRVTATGTGDPAAVQFTGNVAVTNEDNLFELTFPPAGGRVTGRLLLGFRREFNNFHCVTKTTWTYEIAGTYDAATREFGGEAVADVSSAVISGCGSTSFQVQRNPGVWSARLDPASGEITGTVFGVPVTATAPVDKLTPPATVAPDRGGGRDEPRSGDDAEAAASGGTVAASTDDDGGGLPDWLKVVLAAIAAVGAGAGGAAAARRWRAPPLSPEETKDEVLSAKQLLDDLEENPPQTDAEGWLTAEDLTERLGRIARSVPRSRPELRIQAADVHRDALQTFRATPEHTGLLESSSRMTLSDSSVEKVSTAPPPFPTPEAVRDLGSSVDALLEKVSETIVEDVRPL